MAYGPGPSHRRRVYAGSLPPDAQGRRAGVDGQTGGVRGTTGREPALAARPLQVRYVQGAPVRRVHPERRRADTADRDPDLRGQGAAAGGGMVLEAIYEQDFWTARMGSGPAIGARRARSALARAHGDERGLGFGGGHQVLFDSIAFATRDSRPEGTRRGAARTIDKWLKAGVMEGTEHSHRKPVRRKGA